MLSPEQRGTSRNRSEAEIMLLTKDDYAGYKKENSYFTPAKMCNYSIDGMYFESDYAIQPGSDICIAKVKSSPVKCGSEVSDSYRAKVRWCKEIADSNPSCYGIGVQYSESQDA